jgi:hypothetical protein
VHCNYEASGESGTKFKQTIGYTQTVSLHEGQVGSFRPREEHIALLIKRYNQRLEVSNERLYNTFDPSDDRIVRVHWYTEMHCIEKHVTTKDVCSSASHAPSARSTRRAKREVGTKYALQARQSDSVVSKVLNRNRTVQYKFR